MIELRYQGCLPSVVRGEPIQRNSAKMRLISFGGCFSVDRGLVRDEDTDRRYS